MLTRWRLLNFKSAFDTGDLRLRPLTILAGANSSGKSTLIQSILLLAQTLTSPVPGRSLVLNGNIARLGTFSDILAFGREPNISIGLTYKTGTLLQQDARFWSPLREVREVSCDFSFTRGDEGSTELRDLQPSVTQVSIKATRADGRPVADIQVRRALTPPEERADLLNINTQLARPGSLPALRYEVISPTVDALDPRWRVDATPQRIAGATMFHFLPHIWSVVYDTEEASARSRLRDVYSRDPKVQAAARASLPANVREKIAASVGAKRDSFAKRVRAHLESSSESLVKKERGIEAGFANVIEHTIKSTIEANIGQLAEMLRAGKEPALGTETIAIDNEGVRALHYLFRQSVRYLGPLRDEPKPVYPANTSADPDDVGLKGEFTAAVLDLNKDRVVRCVSPKDYQTQGLAAKASPLPLGQAVVDWLEYLGVVRHVQTADKGVYGHELLVSPVNTNTLHSLVHVGVGVSQLLPILVMSLISEAGTVLLFEQPELHLHPLVQARLGDFFLSIIGAGKQCIVETHSEYLVNRLRLRAAEEGEERVPASVALYFVQKRGASSQYQLVELNAFGTMNEWPADFFDQSPRESERILLAALKKKRKMRGGGDK